MGECFVESLVSESVDMVQEVDDRSRRWCEVVGVLATGVLHPVFVSWDVTGVFIALAGIGWVGYLVGRVRHNADQWKQWGFRTDNIGRAFLWPTVVSLVVLLAMAFYARQHGYPLWRGHVAVLLALYPVWGVFQQLLVQALGVANLMALFPRYGAGVAVPIGVFAFSIIHYPEPKLMAATACLAACCIPWYLRDRNLWPLGVYHGWLGTCFYLWVLGRDPWVDVFGP